MTRKVLEGTQHSLLVMGLDKAERMIRHDLGIGRETALVLGDDGIVRVSAQVYHRSQVQIDPQIG